MKSAVLAHNIEDDPSDADYRRRHAAVAVKNCRSVKYDSPLGMASMSFMHVIPSRSSRSTFVYGRLRVNLGTLRDPISGARDSRGERPEATGDKMRYTFDRAIGSKG
jgi:hypothetical protein